MTSKKDLNYQWENWDISSLFKIFCQNIQNFPNVLVIDTQLINEQCGG